MPKHAHSGPLPVADVLQSGSKEFLRQSLEPASNLDVWTKLYAASQTLLAAMRESRVPEALVEICSNLLACEELAIVKIEGQSNRVCILREEGLLPETRAALIQNERFQGLQLPQESPWFPADGGPEGAALAGLGISAIVPLWKDDRSSGAMVLFQLLPQRSGFDDEDRQLLQLLSLFAGRCLRSEVHD